jgi:sporulation-control protein spo0M
VTARDDYPVLADMEIHGSGQFRRALDEIDTLRSLADRVALLEVEVDRLGFAVPA